MHRHDRFRLQHTHRFYSIVRAHREVVPDRYQSQIDRIHSTDHFHFSAQTRVTGMINCLSLHGDQESTWIAGIDNFSVIFDHSRPV